MENNQNKIGGRVISEIDMPEAFCSNSTVTADDFIRILKDIATDMWNESYHPVRVGFFLAQRKNDEVLDKPQLITIDFSQCPQDMLMEAIQEVAKSTCSVAAALMSEAFIGTNEKLHPTKDPEAQDALVLVIDHYYASPNRQLWSATINENISGKELKIFKYCSGGLQDVYFLPTREVEEEIIEA